MLDLFVVKNDPAPNAPLLLYCTCVSAPPGVPPPAELIVISSVASSTVNVIFVPGNKSTSLVATPSLNAILTPPLVKPIAFKLYADKLAFSQTPLVLLYTNSWSSANPVNVTSDKVASDPPPPPASTSTVPLYKCPFEELIHNVLSETVPPLTSLHNGLFAKLVEGRTNPPLSILTQPTK